VLVLCSILVSDQHFVRGEAPLFEAVNGGPRCIGAPLEVVMQLGTLPAAIVVTALVAGAILPGRPLLVVSIAIGVFAAWRLDDVAKEIIERPRPEATLPTATVRDEAGGFGFPSGHTTLAFALAAALHPILPPKVRWIPWALATAVGVARMYVGVHWPMDVVGGAALGIAIGSAASAIGTTRYRRPEA
jgi:membrane-associated phospholipid phosphatase